jgi:hypothetical protein
MRPIIHYYSTTGNSILYHSQPQACGVCAAFVVKC